MLRSIAALLLLTTAWANTQAAPAILAINKVEETQIPPAATTSTTVEHYTLGSVVDGAVPIFQYQNETTYDEVQNEVVVRINYPASDSDPDSVDVDADDDAIITLVSLYVEGSEGFESQAYVTIGGIGERIISVQIVARNTASLRYMIIIEGQKV